jgi:hypothetical protein
VLRISDFLLGWRQSLGPNCNKVGFPPTTPSKSMSKAKYKRILLKISGEALMGDATFGIMPEVIAKVAEDIFAVDRLGVEVAVVIGGGNIFRGFSAASYGRTPWRDWERRPGYNLPLPCERWQSPTFVVEPFAIWRKVV